MKNAKCVRLAGVFPEDNIIIIIMRGADAHVD